MTIKLLQTGPHVERAITYWALIETATNPVERDRYKDRLSKLQEQHPELEEITETDPRIENKIQELKELFAVDERKGEYSDTEEGWKGYR